jgi:tyrosyl-tRNA synthetase
MDLIRKIEGGTAHVLCSPLLTTSSGAKMGKTEHGAVFLDPELTPPYELFQYFVNCDDPDVEKLLLQLTFVPVDEIRELCSVEGAALREAKRRLAWEVTALVHSDEAANESQAAAAALFGGGSGDRSAMPSTALPAAEMKDLSVVDAFVLTGLCKSKGEARRLLTQGGVYVNETRVDDVEARLGADDVEDGEILLRAGKKRYHRLLV